MSDSSAPPATRSIQGRIRYTVFMYSIHEFDPSTPPRTHSPGPVARGAADSRGQTAPAQRQRAPGSSAGRRLAPGHLDRTPAPDPGNRRSQAGAPRAGQRPGPLPAHRAAGAAPGPRHTVLGRLGAGARAPALDPNAHRPGHSLGRQPGAAPPGGRRAAVLAEPGVVCRADQALPPGPAQCRIRPAVSPGGRGPQQQSGAAAPGAVPRTGRHPDRLPAPSTRLGSGGGPKPDPALA